MKNLNLRPANHFDLQLLFNWKNDPVIRKSAFNTKPIMLDEHTKWFNSALENPDIKIYILEDAYNPLGQVRINITDSIGLIDYSIDEKFRGKGYGKKLISLLEEECQRINQVALLKAKVKKDNPASQKVFESLGYDKIEKEDFVEYTKQFTTNIVVSNKAWHRKYINEVSVRTNTKIVYIDQKEKVTYEYLKHFKPNYIFFPHWSYIIPSEVFENFQCVIFHMTDLPFGRGGSPLQNLIERGIYETKLSAIRCVKELDAGEVYMKVPLSLWGSAEEIYLRAAELTKELMVQILKENIVPVPQSGETVIFKRRKPEQSNIANFTSLEKVFDYIRMLDADGYPHAFAETKKLRFEFERASLKENFVKADVKITLKENEDE